ncbi:hypothetical protein G3O00_25645 [Burkholderia sp. Ac-20384]|uniref:hypothetical protein n=1 Tax=Burkholderia sp. Ac-20384 TaxID=2703902 RepID=UPI001980C643|nr:hypothetical protein [Burkholderia sp. Ac-20384]MBN3826984.1 hypothetical protein [Burkholderia sp. Ac-20384]
MEPLQVIQRIEVLTNAIEVAVARADWGEAVRAAEARSMFLMTLVPDQPDEVQAAIGKMREIDIRISTAARETLEALVTEGRKALHETGLAVQSLSRGAQALASRSPAWLS